MVVRLEELAKLAHEVVNNLSSPSVLLLEGNLGAGKTTFVKALAKELGVTQDVSSPTFVLASEYSTQHKKFNKLVHVDLYRLENSVEKESVIREILDEVHEPGRLTAIEWADKLESQIEPAMRLKFEMGKHEDEREINYE